MNDAGRIAATAALLGEPARANMMAALMDGRALTAKELAFAAHVAAPTASGHLARLTEAGLLSVQRQGRHRYFRLATPAIGRMIEAIMAATQPGPVGPVSTWRGGQALRTARTCYDHLAGRLGVGIAEALVARGHVVLSEDGGEVTAAGRSFLDEFGATPPVRPRASARIFCRPCLDWSERRAHIAGAVGAALACRCFELGWIARQRDGRALTITQTGRQGLADMFGVEIPV